MKRLLPLFLFLLLGAAFATQYEQSGANNCGYYNGTDSRCGANTNFCPSGYYFATLACSASTQACAKASTLAGCNICGDCVGGRDTCGTAACGTNYKCIGVCTGLGTGAGNCVSKGGFDATCYCNAMCTSNSCNMTSNKCNNMYKSAPNQCGFYNGTQASCTASINNFCANGYYYPTQLCSATPTQISCIPETVATSCAICGDCLGVGSDTCLKSPCGTTAAHGCALTCDGQTTGAGACGAKQNEGGHCHCDGMCNAPFTCESSVCRLIPQNVTWVYPPANNMNVTGNPMCRMNYNFTLTNATAAALGCNCVARPLFGGIPPTWTPFAPDNDTSCSFDALTGSYNYSCSITDSNGLTNWTNTTGTDTMNFTCNQPSIVMEWIQPPANNSYTNWFSYDFRFNATPTWNNTLYNITDCGLYLTNSTDFYVLPGDYTTTETSNYCLQPHPNVSTSCGGLDTGTYPLYSYYATSWDAANGHGIDKIIDDDWNSCGWDNTGLFAIIEWCYDFPADMSNANIIMGWTNGTNTTATINSNCITNPNLGNCPAGISLYYAQLDIYGGGIYCYDDTYNFYTLGDSSGDQSNLTEISMNWSINVEPFICNVTGYTYGTEDVNITGYAYNAYASNETPTWNFTFFLPNIPTNCTWINPPINNSNTTNASYTFQWQCNMNGTNISACYLQVRNTSGYFNVSESATETFYAYCNMNGMCDAGEYAENCTECSNANCDGFSCDYPDGSESCTSCPSDCWSGTGCTPFDCFLFGGETCDPDNPMNGGCCGPFECVELEGTWTCQAAYCTPNCQQNATIHFCEANYTRIGLASYPINITGITTNNNSMSNSTEEWGFTFQVYGNLTVNYTVGGTATGNNSTFLPPANLTINASADANYSFINWTVTDGNCTVNDTENADTQIEVLDTAPCNVLASFEEFPKANLSLTITGNGTAIENQTDFHVPATYPINATPDTNWTFTNWTVIQGTCTIENSTSQNTNATITASENCTINALFTDNPRANLTVSAAIGGTAIGNQTNFYIPATYLINSSANAGYYFTGWTKISGTCSIGNSSSLNTTAAITVSENCSVRANFALAESSSQVFLWNGFGYVPFNSTNRMRFRCLPTFGTCQPLFQNAGLLQPILLHMNNGTGTSTWQAFSVGATYADAILRCGKSPDQSMDPIPSTTMANYSTENLLVGDSNKIYCFLTLLSMQGSFPKLTDFNFTMG